jgi:hypothetical protein
VYLARKFYEACNDFDRRDSQENFNRRWYYRNRIFQEWNLKLRVDIWYPDDFDVKSLYKFVHRHPVQKERHVPCEKHPRKKRKVVQYQTLLNFVQ